MPPHRALTWISGKIVGPLPGYSRVVIGISHGCGHMRGRVVVGAELDGRACLCGRPPARGAAVPVCGSEMEGSADLLRRGIDLGGHLRRGMELLDMRLGIRIRLGLGSQSGVSRKGGVLGVKQRYNRGFAGGVVDGIHGGGKKKDERLALSVAGMRTLGR